MPDDIKIKIITKQHSIIDGTDISEEYDYLGSMIKKGEKYFIGYIQKDDDGATTTNRIIANESQLVRISSGSSTSRMEFTSGKESKTNYVTPFGTFDMRFMTKYLSVNDDGKSLNITLEYVLTINGEPTSDVQLYVSCVKGNNDD